MISPIDSIFKCCRVLFLQCNLLTFRLRLLWRNDTFFLEVVGLAYFENDDINHTCKADYVQSVKGLVSSNDSDL